MQDEIYTLQTGMGQPHISPRDLAELLIALPPVEVQKSIVAQVNSLQENIDGQRAQIEQTEAEIALLFTDIRGEIA